MKVYDAFIDWEGIDCLSLLLIKKHPGQKKPSQIPNPTIFCFTCASSFFVEGCYLDFISFVLLWFFTDCSVAESDEYFIDLRIIFS